MSGLTIITNPTALVGQRAVSSANSGLSKTIEQLSTGLRINSSSDDASGLAVADKLAGQISGLAVAARNAQDGLSYLQTAEAAMGTMSSMVQRIRELAVQAGDPAYTSNDRVVLQTEVDQLVDEIDRVSTTAEFNTKKLLNGDGSALWTATDGVEALVKGATSSNNYDLETILDPGTNNVYKTNIMAVGAGKTSFDMLNPVNISRLDNIEGVLTDATQNIDITMAKVSASVTAVGTSYITISEDIVASALSSSLSSIITTDGIAFSFEFRMKEDITLATGAATTHTNAFEFRITNLATGQVGDWTSGDVVDVAGTGGATFSAATTVVSAAFTSAGIAGGGAAALSILVTAGQTSFSKGDTTEMIRLHGISHVSLTGVSTVGNAGFAGATGDGLSGVNLYGGSISIEFEAMGDKEVGKATNVRYRVMNMSNGVQSQWFNATVAADGDISASATNPFGMEALREVGLAGRIASSDITLGTAFDKGDTVVFGVGGKDVIDGTTSVAATAIPIVKDDMIFKFGNGPEVLISDAISDVFDKSNKIFTAQVDDAGKVYYGKMDILFGTAGDVATGTTTVRLLGEGDAASVYTRLDKLGNFTNADGRMVLDNTRILTIYGNGTQTDISLESEDTIVDLEDKLTQALAEGLDLGGIGIVNNNLVNFVTSTNQTLGGSQAVAGTFIIQGAAIGADSALAFSADQGVIEGLGVSRIQDGENSKVTATIKDAHTKTILGSDTVTDGVIRGIIENVDIKVDQNLGGKAVWNSVENMLEFITTGINTSSIHIVDNATKAQIGSNEGQFLDISIGRLDSTTLNLKGATLLTFEDSQKTITKADQALEEISSARAVVGAQMNRLDYTISNLNVSRENMTIAESRIRDLNIAEASTRLMTEQVLLQSASAMLAQANQLPSYAAQLIG